MSVIEEDLLAPRITKRRVIEIIVVASLLITLFAFSTFVYALILGSQRREPHERLEDADQEYPIKVFIEPPWDMDDIEELLEDFDINITELAQETGLTEEEIEEYLEEVIPEMLDGTIDDLDLTTFGAAIAALLFSEAEVFRVYDYNEINQVDLREDILWKYECFDEFSGDGWHNTMSPEINNDYFSYEDYIDSYSYLDLIKIRRPLPSPNIGQNSFVIGTLFRQEDPTTAFIIKESIDAPNLEEDETILFKDELGGNTATLTFTSENPVNMTYNIFGQDLLTNEQVNNSAVRAVYTPSTIVNQFTQLPAASLQDYLNDPNHDDIKYHYDILDMIIDQNNDNAFVIANKIRNYLQDESVFTVGFNDLLNDGPVEGEDVVEWFCEHREGSWSEFASAFTVFCRAFGIASRFVDGFNSYNISEDQDENFNYFYAIKWKNIYNWAEIYVPFSTSGSGRWIQMDILRDSFGEGGSPLTDFDLTVESEHTIYSRPSQPEQANITATLSSATRSVENLNIRFYDETIDPDTHFAEILTDANGKASAIFAINDTQVAGPHIIRAEYGLIQNYTYYIVYEPVRVDFINVLPDTVNVSQPIHQTNLIGNLTDPFMGIGVKNALLNIILFNKGTNTILPNAFSPQIIFTDDNGEFDEIVEVQSFVQSGEYEIRIDFNGTWIIDSQYYFYPNINDSSERLEFNVTKEITKSLWFYIEDFETFDYNNPIVYRYNTIELKAIVLDET
ncbi:MAG: transglutaminase domain-containing protein, partial [Promethearchaeota archaeon]